MSSRRYLVAVGESLAMAEVIEFVTFSTVDPMSLGTPGFELLVELGSCAFGANEREGRGRFSRGVESLRPEVFSSEGGCGGAMAVPTVVASVLSSFVGVRG
jgi:hypothetical protein